MPLHVFIFSLDPFPRARARTHTRGESNICILQNVTKARQRISRQLADHVTSRGEKRGGENRASGSAVLENRRK
jgi:hypothetical protein